jgi:RHS repeat-associated protein
MMGKAAFSVILSEGKALVSISYLEYVFWHATCCVLRRNEPSFGENRRIGHTDLILLRSLPFRNRFLSLATYRQTGKRKRETSQSVPFSASITLPTAVSFTAPALTIVNQYDYDAWGNVQWHSPHTFTNVPNRYLFQGREYDAAGDFYYYRYRTYLPEIGMFASPDWNRANGIYGEPLGVGSFVAFNNDPLNATDPLGLADVFVGMGPVNRGFWGLVEAPHWDETVNQIRRLESQWVAEPGASEDCTITVKRNMTVSDMLRGGMENDEVFIFLHGGFKPGESPLKILSGSRSAKRMYKWRSRGPLRLAFALERGGMETVRLVDALSRPIPEIDGNLGALLKEAIAGENAAMRQNKADLAALTKGSYTDAEYQGNLIAAKRDQIAASRTRLAALRSKDAATRQHALFAALLNLYSCYSGHHTSDGVEDLKKNPIYSNLQIRTEGSKESVRVTDLRKTFIADLKRALREHGCRNLKVVVE